MHLALDIYTRLYDKNVMIENEFDELKPFFYFFIKKPIVITRGRSDMGCYFFVLRRLISISCFFGDNMYIVSHLDL
jgi:hypothetical protein